MQNCLAAVIKSILITNGHSFDLFYAYLNAKGRHAFLWFKLVSVQLHHFLNVWKTKSQDTQVTLLSKTVLN